MQGHAAESGRPPAVFDFGKTQQRRDDRQRLIDICDRLVDNRLELFDRRCVGAAALERKPRPRQRRAQVVGDVVADAGERVDHRFHFIEHAVDDDGELRERLVDITVRKPFAQVAGDDALDPLVDLFDPLLGAHAQPRAGQQAQEKRRQQAQRERLTDDVGDLPRFVDLTSDHQRVAAWHSSGDRADDVNLPSSRHASE